MRDYRFPALTYPVMEFHLSRRARERYNFDEGLHAFSGAVIFSNFAAARAFATKMNARRDLKRHPEEAVRASDLHAIGLIDELTHALIAEYRQRVEPEIFTKATRWLCQHPGQAALERTLGRFAEDYPVVAVYRGELSAGDYLEGETADVPHRHAVLEEMILLWLANGNPAFAPYKEIFDDLPLRRKSHYDAVMLELQDFFRAQKGFGPKDASLLELLRSPALASPNSLYGQLDYIRDFWAPVLGSSELEGLFTRLLRGLDWLKEEAKQSFFGLGPGPAQVLDREALAGRRMEGPGGFAAGSTTDVYGAAVLDPAALKEPEYERFSPDLSWMPRLVLMAKSTYVWLGQLSERYGRDIHRLDLVPDEELDTLAAQGFTGLWLIGLWERSHASKTIKQLMGNPDAVASAYSLYDYVIAQDLGGEEAYENLRARAWARGIRLASDMVPNHVGIDGRWVIEHPEWFVSVDEPPFPSYTFGGPDLSQDGRVGIFLEDHYYDHSDAAVVFKRLDRHTGEAKYIYHGNDGTSMAWNDTAQLDYLKAEVREAVIQTILHVARKFSVIRFDAAMTLAKQHIQRLWYPHPGTGGDIASRAEHGLTKAEFDRLVPVEFWREVVDRVAQEVPDTLLLAEAFWMMEGYFVRTLGMHRVYNSAFMHMFKREDNDKYRQLIKNTLEFDPEILKRFVNFMNNPDEETAVAQFGKDDKYFGVCVVMSTLPGLPMFGHGQVEGLHEKYGMEYRRAKWQETPDDALVRRHEREIFPLLHKRHLFADVGHFLLYDFFAPEGYVNENVFAYSNRAGDERALVVFNNKFADARGWIKTSAAYAVKTEGGKELRQRSLAEGLGLGGDEGFVVYRDSISGLEYLRSVGGLRKDGLFIELGAFKYVVFLDFREVGGEGYGRLMERLGGRGVRSVDEALRGLELEPLVQAFREVVSGERYRRLHAAFAEDEDVESATADLAEPLRRLLEQAGRMGGREEDAEKTKARADEGLRGLGDLLEALATVHNALGALETGDAPAPAGENTGLPDVLFYAALNLHVLRALEPLAEAAPGEAADGWLDRWFLSEPLSEAVRDAPQALALTRLLLRHEGALERALAAPTPREGAGRLLATLLDDPLARDFLGVHTYQGADYFNKEGYDALSLALVVLPQLEAMVGPGDSREAGNGETADEDASSADAANKDPANKDAAGKRAGGKEAAGKEAGGELERRAALLAELRAAEAASAYRLDGLRAYFAAEPGAKREPRSTSGDARGAVTATFEMPVASPEAEENTAAEGAEADEGTAEGEDVKGDEDEEPGAR